MSNFHCNKVYIFCHVRIFKHCMVQGILCHVFHWYNDQQLLLVINNSENQGIFYRLKIVIIDKHYLVI